MAHRTKTRREDGAVLVLALVFMIVIALVLLGVVTLSGNGLLNTSTFSTSSRSNTAASGAMQVAIQTVRYTNTAFPPTPQFVLLLRHGDPGGTELPARVRGLLDGAPQPASRPTPACHAR